MILKLRKSFVVIIVTIMLVFLGQVAWSASLSVDKGLYFVSAGSTVDGVVDFTDGSAAAGGRLELTIATPSIATVWPASISMTIGSGGYVDINQVFTITGLSGGGTILTVRGLDPYGKEYIKVQANVTVIDCPITLSLEGSAGDDQLEPFYRFRDGVLAQNDKGKEYIRQYYRHAWEASYLMLRHPDLLEKSRDVLLQILPAVQARLAGHEGAFGESEQESLDGLLSAFETFASPNLKEALQQVRKDLASRDIAAHFGLSGPKH